MNSILGGGISSHLFQKIREERGLAYNVYSYPSTYRETGTYAIYVGTGPGKVREFFALLREELERFIREGVTAEEVRRTQSQIKAKSLFGDGKRYEPNEPFGQIRGNVWKTTP